MGIARSAGNLLILEAKRRPFSGSILQLGKQDIQFNTVSLFAWAKQHGFKLRSGLVATKLIMPDTGLVTDDVTLFKHLGFDEVRSLDIDQSEGADFQFDLNKPMEYATDEEWERRLRLKSQFDCVFDGGTMEHIFDVPAVLRNIHGFLKPGGRVIHQSPVANYTDHGFYTFSPTLFHDYYAANRYRIEASYLIASAMDPTIPGLVLSYRLGSMDSLSFGGLRLPLLTPDGKEHWVKYDIFFVATKTPESTCGMVPQQSRFKRQWTAERMNADHQAGFRVVGIY